MSPPNLTSTNPQALASGLRVLLVDDVAMNRRVAELFLHRLGCSVVSAESAQSALERIHVQEFDVVMTDVEMPDLGGMEALALFREADARAHPQRLRRLAVMAVSAGVVGMEHGDYLAAGFDEHLAKPLELDQLRRALARLQSA